MLAVRWNAKTTEFQMINVPRFYAFKYKNSETKIEEIFLEFWSSG